MPNDVKETIKSKYAYKINYMITLPGLILPYDEISGKIVNDKKTQQAKTF
ncbi:MAG: hypothetical protein L6V95_05840 [Candidatus Melainabacteria bacterium]|nr:MAG: hypothetical protein L6V95_05840 [Candidatus Melainabacteria bacterium]